MNDAQKKECREAFEKAFSFMINSLNWSDKKYTDLRTQGYWIGFQAAWQSRPDIERIVADIEANKGQGDTKDFHKCMDKAIAIVRQYGKGLEDGE